MSFLSWMNDRQKRKILEAIQNGTPEGDTPDVSPVHELPQNRDPSFTPRQDPIIPNNDAGFTRPQATPIAPALSAPASYNPRVGAPFESPTLAEAPPELLGSNPPKASPVSGYKFNFNLQGGMPEPSGAARGYQAPSDWWTKAVSQPDQPTTAQPTGAQQAAMPATSPAPVDHIQQALDRLNELENSPVKDKNGRVKSILLGLWHGLQRGGVAGAIFGGIEGAVNPKWDEMLKNGTEVAKAKNYLKTLLDVAKTQSTIGNQGSLVQTREANSQRQAQKLAQSKIFRNLGLLKGQKLDRNIPAHAQLLEEAEQAGIHIDPDAWNNSAGNEIAIPYVDPDNPTIVQTATLNKVTGEVKVVAARGYTQPVDAKTGLTAAQTGTAKAREEAARARGRTQAETARHNRAMEGQGQTRIAQGQTRIAQSEAKQKQSQELHVNKDIAALRDMHAELSGAVDKDAAIEKIITQEEYMSSLYPDDERVKKAIEHSQKLRESEGSDVMTIGGIPVPKIQ